VTALILAPWAIVSVLWLAWIGSWIVFRRWAASPVRPNYHFVLAVGAVLTLLTMPFDPLWKFLSAFPSLAWAGVALVLLGFALTCWGRAGLGRSPDAAATPREDRVRPGRWSIRRHPIYAGTLLALAGTALVDQRVSAYVAWTFAFFALVKLREEGRLWW
jgi:protein-S-isoprenylcysteine O-methyltransferase Ste14